MSLVREANNNTTTDKNSFSLTRLAGFINTSLSNFITKSSPTVT